MKGSRRVAWLVAPLCVALMGLAPSPPVAAPDPNESAVVQELEVVGRYPGPPLWTVRRGAGEVVVMGALSPLPHMLEWNSHRLERLMDGAQEVLLPPTGRVGPLDVVYILFHAGDFRLPAGRTLWDEITPEQRRRFDSLRLQAKTDAKRYEKLKPVLAGLTLAGDFEKAAGLSSAKPGSTVKRLAEAHHLRTREEGGIPVIDLFRAGAKMDAAANRACLDAELTETEHDASRARPLADAWANGDLKAVKAELGVDSVNACLAGTAGLQGFIDKLTRDAAGSIDAALKRGGRTIAVVDLRLLLHANGVLDRLKADGADITVPRE